MGPPRDRARRIRNAGSYADAQDLRPEEGAKGRSHCRLPAHDHPDGCAHRDARRARR